MRYNHWFSTGAKPQHAHWAVYFLAISLGFADQCVGNPECQYFCQALARFRIEDSKMLHIALRGSMLFPQQVQRCCEVMTFWASCPEAGRQSVPENTLLIVVWLLLHHAWSKIPISRRICYCIHNFHNCFPDAQLIMFVFYFGFQSFFHGNFQ